MKLSKAQCLIAYLTAQALILLIFYSTWLSNSNSYFFRDLTHYIEPFGKFTGESMRHFEIPMWNPWNYCGMPQIAISVQGICYPPTALFAIMPFSSALASSMVLHQWICGAGGFLLVLSLGWGFLPAIICGTTLAMSGYEFCFTSIFSLVESSAWCPLSIWAIHQLGKSPSTAAKDLREDQLDFDQSSNARSITDQDNSDHNASPAYSKHVAIWTGVLALIISMHALAGHPELGSIEFAILGAYIAYSAWQDFKSGNSQWQQNAILKIRAIFIGVLLAMPTILPSFEWLGLSRRSAGLAPQEALILSANWYDVLGLALAQPLGDMQARWSEFRPLVMNGQLLPYMASAFVGPIAISMAIWSLCDREWKERWWIFGATVLALLLAMGGNTPLVPLLLSIAKSSIRFPVKLMFFVVWGIALMAARGLYVLLQKRLNRAWLLTLLCWTVSAALAGLLICKVPLLDSMLQFNSMSIEMQTLLRKATPYIGWAGLIAASTGIACSLAAFAYQKWQKN